MVENGQSGVPSVAFASRIHEHVPVEVIDRRTLLSRVGADRLATPQRPLFGSLVLMHSATGSHTVDFAEIEARPGRMIQIRPGQVQAWNTEADFDATVILAKADTPSLHPWFPGDEPYADLDTRQRSTTEAIIDELRRLQTGFDDRPSTIRLMQALSEALVAMFDRAHGGLGRRHQPEVYVAFRRAVESDLTQIHDVTAYARRLGYSPRTITRACQIATGRTAKGVLTERLVLEAKRLLVHTAAPASTISGRLGFSEPTNFTKFFARHTGQTPSAFRREHRGT